MRVMLVGQKWLGAEVLAMLLAKGHDVASVAAPAADRLHEAAVAAGIPVADPGRVLAASWMPPGVELLIAAHAHCFIAGDARKRARLGAIGYHPSLLPRHRGRDAVRWTIHASRSPRSRPSPASATRATSRACSSASPGKPRVTIGTRRNARPDTPLAS